MNQNTRDFIEENRNALKVMKEALIAFKKTDYTSLINSEGISAILSGLDEMKSLVYLNNDLCINVIDKMNNDGKMSIEEGNSLIQEFSTSLTEIYNLISEIKLTLKTN